MDTLLFTSQETIISYSQYNNFIGNTCSYCIVLDTVIAIVFLFIDLCITEGYVQIQKVV